MMKKTLVFITLLATVLSFGASSISADYGVYGYGQYGQPVSSQTILVDKKVGMPAAVTKGGITEVQYVDNLTPSSTKFKPGQAVMFQVKVKNTSNVDISNVTVKDYVPGYVEPVEGFGTYDSSTRIITLDAGSFKAGEEKVYYVKMQLYGQAPLPADKGLFCLTNKAAAYNGSASDEDTAQFCVEKEVIGAKEAPKAGPEAGMLLLGAQTALMGIGYGIKKLTARK